MDGARFGKLLGDPPRIVSEGRYWPLAINHIGRDATQRIEPQMASAIRRGLAEVNTDLADAPEVEGREAMLKDRLDGDIETDGDAR